MTSPTPRHQVGDLLPNGATVVADDIVVTDDGTTIETIVDSAGNSEQIFDSAAMRAQAQALSNLHNLLAQLPAGLQQGQADAAAWPTADQATRDQIMVRLIQNTTAIADGVGLLVNQLGLAV